MTTITMRQFVPYVTSSRDACPLTARCALQKGHPGDCYAIDDLWDPDLRARLLEARSAAPGAPATEGSEGGAERLGKITSNVSVPTHAEGGSDGKR